RRLLGAWLLFGDALFQSIHQIYHRRKFRMRDLGDFVAGALRFDHALHAFLILILVLFRFERSGEAFNELRGEFLLGVLGLRSRVGAAIFGDLANFVGVEHRVQSHAVGAGANDDDVLALVHRQLCDRGVAGGFHGVEQKGVSFLAFIFRRDV